MTTLREKQIRFLNSLCYLFMALAILNSLAMLNLFGIRLFSVFGFVIAGFFYFTLLLNRFGHHFYAKMMILLLLHFAIINISSTQGKGSGSILLYFPLISLYFLIFESKEWPWILFWTFASFMAYIGLEISNYNLIRFGELPKPDPELIFRFNLFLSVLGEFLIMSVFIRVSRELEDSFLLKAEEAKKSIEEMLLAKEKAEKAANARSLFLSSMSHEIRTPINSIIGFTNLLLEENPTPDQKNYLSMIDFSSKNLLVIINDILDYNKMEAGKVRLEAIPFNLFLLISNIYHSLKIKSDEKNLKFTYDLDPRIPKHIIGDPVRLTQILFNLLSNAIKFTLSGEIILKVSLSELKKESVILIFSVKDTGIGISSEKQGNIFDQFTQADSSTTRKFGGTGLGLSIVKRLIALFDSTIYLSSEEGKGSEFSFRLKMPLAMQIESDLNQTPKGNSIQKNSAYPILIVDDNELNLKVASQFIKKWGYLCETTTSGENALEILRNKPISMILMDLQMPGWDGFETVKKIREDGFMIPIIALTADVIEEDSEQDRSYFQDIIYKPFQPQELLEKIKSNL